MKLTKTQKKIRKLNRKEIVKKTDPVEQAISWNRYLSVNEYTTRRVTFGKYVNIMIKDLPIDYLEWGCLNLNYTWSEYFIREWKRRNPNWKTMKI